jgi:hypothetical protein
MVVSQAPSMRSASGNRVPHPHGVVVTAGDDAGAVVSSGLNATLDTASMWPVNGRRLRTCQGTDGCQAGDQPPPSVARVFDWLPVFIVVAGVIGLITDSVPDDRLHRGLPGPAGRAGLGSR